LFGETLRFETACADLKWREDKVFFTESQARKSADFSGSAKYLSPRKWAAEISQLPGGWP